jgi:hypothetical protein
MSARVKPLARVLLVVLFARLSAADEVKSYTGYKLLRVNATTPAQVAAIESDGGIILNCIPAPGRIDVVADDTTAGRIRARGLIADVVHADVQALIDAQRQQPVPQADPFTDYFLAYHRYGDAATSGTVVWYLNQLVVRYPNLASLVNIGNSLEGRPMWALRIANDAVPGAKPAVCYYCCQHAREWITTTVVPYHARHLLANYATDPHVRDMVDHVEIFLIPVSNPDGYEYTWTNDRLWRKNRRLITGTTYGIDLNRNWGFAWGVDNDGSSPTPSSATYRGSGPFSEPETQVLRDFFLAHPNIRAMLDIHSYSQLILWPWGYTAAPSTDQAEFAEVGFDMQALIAAVHGKAYTAGPTYTTIYPVNGDGCDWAYGERDIFAFSFELRPLEGAFGVGFELSPTEIIPQNQELLPAMLRLTNSHWVRSPVAIDLPSGVPEEIAPGVDTVIPVIVRSNFETLTAGSAKLHYRYDANGPFIEAPLVPLGGNDYQAILPATNCASTPQFYFAAASDQGSTVTNPYPGPNAPYTATIATGRFLFTDLETNPNWTIDAGSEWQWGTPQGLGSVNKDPLAAHSGSNVYGYDLAINGDYAVSLPAKYLTTTALDCTNQYGVHLRFWRWLGVESAFHFDEATIEVSSNGTSWTVIWRATDTGGNVADNAWKFQEFDISSVADNQPTLYVRWGMGPTDDSQNYPGWNIDDVELYATSCRSAVGDYNGDGAITGRDYPAFAPCQLGPGGGVNGNCSVFDFDGSSAVDLFDFAALQRAGG